MYLTVLLEEMTCEQLYFMHQSNCIKTAIFLLFSSTTCNFCMQCCRCTCYSYQHCTTKLWV